MGQFFSLLIGYIIGAVIQTSYWYGKKRNMDIRRYGSGNAGTTNAMRTMGKKAGVITAVGDVAKVFLSALISWAIFRGTGMPTMLIFLYSGLGTVLGHCFPFYMGFRGGKGVATTAGVIISLFFLPYHCWVMTLLGVLTFFGVLIVTRYASLASLCLVTEFLIEIIIWGAFGNTMLSGSTLAQGICLVIIITAVTYLKHRGNIERLLNGNERKFGEKVKTASNRRGRRTNPSEYSPRRSRPAAAEDMYERRGRKADEDIYMKDSIEEDYGFEEGYEDDIQERFSEDPIKTGDYRKTTGSDGFEGYEDFERSGRDERNNSYNRRDIREDYGQDYKYDHGTDRDFDHEDTGHESLRTGRNLSGRDINNGYDRYRRSRSVRREEPVFKDFDNGDSIDDYNSDSNVDEFVRDVREDEMPDKSDPNYGREFIWDAEKNRYVRYRDYEFKD